MNESEFARKIREHLNFGARRLDRDVAVGLETARRRALEQMPMEHAHAWATAGGRGTHGGHGHPLRRWLPLAMLLVVLGGVLYWQQMQMQQDEDIDAALLADDLPVDAYLDHGFHAWLERSSQR